MLSDLGGGKTRVDVAAENAAEDRAAGLGGPAARRSPGRIRLHAIDREDLINA